VRRDASREAGGAPEVVGDDVRTGVEVEQRAQPRRDLHQLRRERRRRGAP